MTSAELYGETERRLTPLAHREHKGRGRRPPSAPRFLRYRMIIFYQDPVIVNEDF